jgi:hypothetical protein
MSDQTALAGRIRAYLDDLEKVVARTALLANKAMQSGDDGYWDGVALNLHNFYSCAERVFEDIARTMDGSMPSGSDWHVHLLVQMTSEVAGRRPPVISPESRYAMDEYRSFRHVVRNIYAFQFRPSRLQELVNGLPGCFQSLKEELLNFAQSLDSMVP